MDHFHGKKLIVFKIGSSTLTHETGRLDLWRMETLARVLSDIKNAGTNVVLVSSGAVAAGAAHINLEHRARSTEEKQALAAVGQTELMRLWERFFSAYGHSVGQILMTRDVVDNESRLSHVRATFAQLIKFGCVPVVNENDTVSGEELQQFGGNDILSAYVAIVCGAELIVNMTDIDGLYDTDPRKNENASLISRIDKIDDAVLAMAGGAGTERGTGGMIAKIKAAKIASDAGIPSLIINGRDPSVIYDIKNGKHLGTYFAAGRG